MHGQRLTQRELIVGNTLENDRYMYERQEP